QKAPTPAAVGVLVADLADHHPAIGQFRSALLDVGDHQIQTLYGAGGRVGQADAQPDRGGRSLGRQLDGPEFGGRVPPTYVVDVEVEADLVAVEPQRPVGIGDRQNDNFEQRLHRLLPEGVVPSTSSVSSPRSTPCGMTVWPGSSCSCLPSR